MLKIKVLMDDCALPDKYYTAEHGFCLFIENDGQYILLDCGYSGAFVENAGLMDCDLTKLDFVVLSHGHNDHSWGLNHLIQYYDRKHLTRKPQLIMHPDAAVRKRSKSHEIGIALDENVLRAFFDLRQLEQPEKLTEKLWWLGEIPRKIELEKALGKRFPAEREEDDFLRDDSALVYDGEDGLVILTGCSHSGICNIVDYAAALTGKDKIADIIGGFHLLKESGDRLRETGKWLAARSPKTVHPCHCTDLKAKIALAEYLPLEETGVGATFEYR